MSSIQNEYNTTVLEFESVAGKVSIQLPPPQSLDDEDVSLEIDTVRAEDGERLEIIQLHFKDKS